MCLFKKKKSVDVEVQMSPPWNTYSNMLEALFEKDPEVTFTPIDEDYTIKIESENVDKIKAITQLVGKVVKLGNIKVDILTNAPIGTYEEITADTYMRAFKGNSNFVDVVTVTTPLQFPMTYVVWAKEIIQFYNDDISDLYCNFNAIVEDVASAVLYHDGFEFSTANGTENKK